MKTVPLSNTCLPTCNGVVSKKVSCRDDAFVSTLTALSSDEPVEEHAVDAECLLDVLRLYRWQISSSEEQVSCVFEYFPIRCCELCMP